MKHRDRVSILTENRRSDSTHQTKRAKNLEIAVDKCSPKLARKKGAQRVDAKAHCYGGIHMRLCEALGSARGSRAGDGVSPSRTSLSPRSKGISARPPKLAREPRALPRNG